MNEIYYINDNAANVHKKAQPVVLQYIFGEFFQL